MKSQVVLVFLVAIAFLESSALTQNQVFHLLELNAGFEVLHRNFDFRINNALADKSHFMQVINAQLISRIGFIHDEIKAEEVVALAEIEQRATDIANPDAECITDARNSLENAVDYAGYNMMGQAGEAMFYLNQIETSYFYPLINVLQMESNIIQWMILSELRRVNPVTNADLFIQRIEDDYTIMVILYQSAITNIQREMNNLDDRMNEVKSSYFPQLDSTRDYFMFTVRFIKDALTLCEA